MQERCELCKSRLSVLLTGQRHIFIGRGIRVSSDQIETRLANPGADPTNCGKLPKVREGGALMQ